MGRADARHPFSRLIPQFLDLTEFDKYGSGAEADFFFFFSSDKPFLSLEKDDDLSGFDTSRLPGLFVLCRLVSHNAPEALSWVAREAGLVWEE